MKREWKVRREFKAYPDGEQRWDRAYQHLLKWTLTTQPPANVTRRSNSQPLQEVDHAGSSLCASFDTAPGAATDH
jgi:hypothetical protein